MGVLPSEIISKLLGKQPGQASINETSKPWITELKWADPQRARYGESFSMSWGHHEMGPNIPIYCELGVIITRSRIQWCTTKKIDLTLHSQKTPNIWLSYRVSIVCILEKTDCVITAPHCNLFWSGVTSFKTLANWFRCFYSGLHTTNILQGQHSLTHYWVQME